MTADSIQVDEALLVLKIAFLVLLYVFIWRIVRSASKEIVAPTESFVLAPDRARSLGLESPHHESGRLVVVKSPTLAAGENFVLNSAPLSVGRSGANDIDLRGDGFASAAHARFEARRDGIWLEDVGSTNGTFVNGVRIEGQQRLSSGDVVRIGETDLRLDT
jgi:hypothetical protein